MTSVCVNLYLWINQFYYEYQTDLAIKSGTIEKAKEYASERKVSLSKIVDHYLQSLTSEESSNGLDISPFMKSISTGTQIPVDLYYKQEYSDYPKKKYK